MRARGDRRRIGRRHAVAALFASVLALAISPAFAMGSTISISGSTLSYNAALGEVNTVTVSRADDGTGAYLIEDLTATISAPACNLVDIHHAECPAGAIRGVVVWLNDLDDELTITETAYPTVPATIPMRGAGGPGDDTLIGASGADTLSGGSGADEVFGDAGRDQVDGYDDALFAETAADDDDLVDGGPDADFFVRGGPGDDLVLGGDGDDPVVQGEEGDDLVDGGAGADDVVGGPGDDDVRGGAGSDLVDVGGTGLAHVPAQLNGKDTVDGGAGNDRLGVELAAPFFGDTLIGGEGSDTLSYSARQTSVSVRANGLPDDGAVGEGDNVAGDIEQWIGGHDVDTLVGGAIDNVIDGGPSDDLIDGGEGNDTLQGGLGDGGSDGMVGGPGVDLVQGGPGEDSLDGGDGDDDVRGGGGSDTAAGGAGRDQVAGGPGLDTVSGGDGDDVVRGGDAVLIGADGADEVRGDAGNDTLLSGPGNDLLDGGAGADLINGEAGRDAVTYEGRFARVTVTFDGLANDGEPGENDNVGSDVEDVIGSDLADTLTGDERANRLAGGSGEDLIRGLAGVDSLEGGSAPDIVDARDGIRERVDCGAGSDLAILDRSDITRDCESVDRSAAREPVLARSANVVATRGQPTFKLPGAQRYAPLDASVELPLGATLDARTARVRVTTARTARTRQSAVFARGQFRIRQTRARRPITVIALRGGDFSQCDRPGVPRNLAVRLVWGRGKGKYRTRGRYGSGGVRGTTWQTVDRCDGTLTRVINGTVRVRDFTLRRTVVLHTGERYLARAPSGR